VNSRLILKKGMAFAVLYEKFSLKADILTFFTLEKTGSTPVVNSI